MVRKERKKMPRKMPKQLPKCLPFNLSYHEPFIGSDMFFGAWLVLAISS